MLTGKNVQLIADTTGTGPQPGVMFQLGPDVAGSLVVQVTATGTCTAEGRLDANAPWVQLPGTGSITANSASAISRTMPEMRLNISANTGTIRAWIMA